MACGVLGIALKDGSERSMTDLARTGLMILNHRGEAAHGIAYINGSRAALHDRRRPGLVQDSNIFSREINGRMLIGHTRYGTSGSEDVANAGPMQFVSDDMTHFAVALNGNITNDEEIKGLFRNRPGYGDFYHTATSDVVAIGEVLKRVIRRNSLEPERIAEALDPLLGAYSMTILVNGDDPAIIAVRDRYGRMPLRVGESNDAFLVASESVAFGRRYLAAPYHTEVMPGELVVVRKNGFKSQQVFEVDRLQLCFFQWIYMARPETSISGVVVADVRKKLGEVLASRYRPDDIDIVIPVLDSGAAGAGGYSSASGVPLSFGIIKNKYETLRGFMRPTQRDRESTAEHKYSIIPSEVSGKRVLVFDDSLVRGTTSRRLISELREDGAIEVHLAFSCPPITSQCVFGIDHYNSQLLARSFRDMSPEEINIAVAQTLGADGVYYNTVSDLVNSIGIPQRDLCISCLDGVYVPAEIRVMEQRTRREGLVLTESARKK